MQFILTPTVPYPMGLERETAEMAHTLRAKYDVFFRWVQEGEVSPVSEASLPELLEISSGQMNTAKPAADLGARLEASANGPWLLESWDIEYFYGLSRPADVNCACPYGWVEKVKRIVDQQYPIFGVERFPDLFAKGVHMAWLLLKNQVFPEYNGGVAALSLLVLLQRNDYSLEPSDGDLIKFTAAVRKFIQASGAHDEAEDSAIRQLAGMIQSWKR